MACICIGYISSGKTLLLKRLQGIQIDCRFSTVETVGTNIIKVANLPPSSNGDNGNGNNCAVIASSNSSQKKEDKDFVSVREIGGSMSPLWASYYSSYKPIIYVIDSSNLFQVSIATVHLMGILSHEKLIRCRILIFLTKLDLTDTKKLNLLKFTMRLDSIITQIGNRVTLPEASAMTGDGMEEVRKWIVDNAAFSARLYQIENGKPMSAKVV